jgi:hypothetical protein
MTRICLLVLVVGLAAAAAAASKSDGRWKIGSDGGCYFDDTDSGPDQCLPPGRWKIGDDGGCYFDAEDSGPNQCTPAESTASAVPQAATSSLRADRGRIRQLR